MFIALKQNEAAQQGILTGIRNILTRKKPAVQHARALGATYAVLNMPQSRRDIDWAMVAAACDRYADRLLLPMDTAPPHGYKCPDFPAFKREVLLETVCNIIERSGCPMYRRLAGIIDPDGRHSDMLEELIKHYTCVKVLTNSPERYMPEIERMMNEYGAPVVFAPELLAMQDCAVLLAPSTISPLGATRLSVPLFAAYEPPESLRLSNVFTGLAIAPPTEMLDEMPEGINPQEFAAALYEFCSVRGFRLVADKLLYNHRISTFTEAAYVLEAHIRLNNW